MLKEDDVNQFMRVHLENSRYLISEQHLGTAKGNDIEAVNEYGKIVVECKGTCSPRGNVFSVHESYERVCSAVFNVIKESVKQADKSVSYALAFPANGHYKELLNGMEDFFRQIKVKIYWVADNGRVDEQS